MASLIRMPQESELSDSVASLPSLARLVAYLRVARICQVTISLRENF